MPRQSPSQPKTKKRSLTTKLTVELYQALGQHVDAKDTDMSKYMRAALREKLHRDGIQIL